MPRRRWSTPRGRPHRKVMVMSRWLVSISAVCRLFVDLASAMWARRRRRKEAEPLPAVRALHLPREDLPERPRSHQVTAAEVVECSRFEAGLRINGAAERAVRDHCFEIVPATAPGKWRAQKARQSSSTGGSPFADVRSGASRDSVAGGVYPPAMAVASGSFPRPSSNPRTALTERSRIRGPCQGEGEAEVAKVLCVLYEDPVDGYPRSYARDAIPRIERYYDGRTTPTPSGSTSSRVGFWAAFPGSSGCGGSSRSAAALLSRRTRTGRTRSSSESSRTLRSSSPSRSGLPT